MKKLSLLLPLWPALLQAMPITTETWTVACSSLATVMEKIEPYKEKPAIIGELGTGTLLFLMNSETGTWTVVVTDGKRACVIADGESAQINK